ncbi:electron transfer flavoprotein beta subunit/FixA family protein [bacterium]|nr:MAG: electron transfer flavoprotein beta subunit/FixA family protein [bacterium]
MKVLVPVKRVQNPEVKVRLAPGGLSVDSSNVNFILNSFDEYAVEEAVRIVEKEGGEVVLVSIGLPECEETLRAGLALGGDRGWLVECSEPPDSFGVASILAAVYNEEKPDLVVAGKQSVDTDNGQAAQMLAALLGLPQAINACKVELLGKRARVSREIDGGIEVKEVPLPAVITADLRLNQPRYASLPAIMKAKRKELKKTTPAALGVELTNSVTILSFAEPPERAPGRMARSVGEFAEALAAAAKTLKRSGSQIP